MSCHVMVSLSRPGLNRSVVFFHFRPEAVAQCILNLIKDESDVGQVVRVTYDDGVEFLEYNDVSSCMGWLTRVTEWQSESELDSEPQPEEVLCSGGNCK